MHDTPTSVTQARIAPPQNILLVDDDAISMEILSVMLGHDGHHVECAIDGESALHLLAGKDSSARPDVLLVDMQMPGISGFELARRIRALTGNPPRLLAMSATAVGARELRAFDGFLLKPPAMEELRLALEIRSVESAPASAPGAQAKRRRAAKPASPPGKSHVSAPGPVSGESVNWAVVEKLAKAMSERSLRELFQACIDDSRRRIEGMQTLAKEGRVAEIPRAAHQVKGAASMIGATGLSGLAATLETGSCKEVDIPRLLDDLLGACDTLERMLLADKSHRANN